MAVVWTPTAATTTERTGGYQCHRGPAAGQEYASQADMLRTRTRYSPATEQASYDDQVEPQSLEVIQGKVVSIRDGDTATILSGTKQYKIRLAEIDTPERGQPYGSRARQALSKLIYGRMSQQGSRTSTGMDGTSLGCTRGTWT